MSVSARTFQLLYIVRQRALKDLHTTLPDFSAFIAERRAEAPQTYDRAYISPSSLQEILDRMCSPMENLLAHSQGQFSLDFMGSQMADLLDGIDGCSSIFIDGYKEQVVKAVLEQRLRLGMPPANQRDIAATANISLDSARRGLQTLVDSGVITESTKGRNQTYALITTAAVEAGPTTVEDASQSIRDTLAGVSDDRPKKPVPDALVGFEEGDLIPEAPVPLGTVLQDGGPDVEAPKPTLSVEEAEEDEVGVPTLAEVQEALQPNLAGMVKEDVLIEEALKELDEPPRSKYTAEDRARFMEKDASRTMRNRERNATSDWLVVSSQIRMEFMHQAEACGMPLDDYLSELARMASLRFRRALSNTDDHRLRTLVDKVIYPPYRGAHKCSGDCQQTDPEGSKS